MKTSLVSSAPKITHLLPNKARQIVIPANLTRAPVDGAIQHELAEARFIADDLADHMFGHLVPTDMARDILKKFVVDGVVEVCESKPSVGASATILDKKSEAVQRALDAAFKDSASSGGYGGESDEGCKVQPHFWRWKDFPKAPLGEDALVEFLNKITDSALNIAKPQLGDAKSKVRNRFAAPEDEHHAVPLAYEADREDMRPDFLVLPIEAFSSDMKTVDQEYVNFTALRAVGESKNKKFRSGLEQVYRYARGIRRAQPWVHFVLAVTMTQEKMCLVRGDSSGTERLELVLSDGRGCIEFIRILLGLALAEGIDLGQNPEVELRSEMRSCIISKPPPPHKTTQTHHGRNSQAAVSSSNAPSAPASLSVEQSSEGAVSSLGQASYTSGASVPSHSRSSAGVSSSSKRKYSEVDDGADGADDQSNLPKKEKKVERIAFIPIKVYGHQCIGILFTAGSIRGRGTVVFCVVDLDDHSKRLALKTSWQDLQREEERDDVLERLKEKGSHPNLIVHLSTNFKARTKNGGCTTLGTIRAFLGDQLHGFLVENRVLSVSLSELKQPVTYFWGVHDFVRGLRGAILGHKYLTRIGILHRDISENNIVLACQPEEPGPDTLPRPSTDESEPMKALRTGTTPYMSFNVLYGRKHTYFDDMESFLYVLLLFFFSYAGPLSKEELGAADNQGFVQLPGSGRLSHTRCWPKTYAMWADQFRLRGKMLLSTIKTAQEDDVLERLKEKGSHPNLIIPFKNFKARTKNEDCTTLGTIRAFLGDHLSELKRPVKYFWGVHDFVRGLRGAILGHEYLTRIGILHRDISENNIVLARRPGEERGYLIDFDMAILQEPKEPGADIVTTEDDDVFEIDAVLKASSPIPLDESEPLKALQTGTTPYLSFNVLYGRKHTYFDDMESFLYVLLLFFFSYAGPLSKEELGAADNQGFVQLPGSGRLSHTRCWPKTYAMWADGALPVIAKVKDADLNSKDCPKELVRSVEVRNCLKDNWDTGIHRSIQTLLFWSWTLFVKSRFCPGPNATRTQVEHGAFVDLLDKWLERFSGDEEKFSNCPFL
ncbi:hypothetical protein BU15DRAFT_80781 [Melanogaster broomeanus]|nr:hypothetical protein BU15DRAFT_80781 [Melanogaster broomeanus]